MGFIASPTSRSALGADILVTDQACLRAVSVQVKTNASAASFWLAGKRIPSSDTHIYVLVNLKSKEIAVYRSILSCRARLLRSASFIASTQSQSSIPYTERTFSIFVIAGASSETPTLRSSEHHNKRRTNRWRRTAAERLVFDIIGFMTMIGESLRAFSAAVAQLCR